MPPDITLIDWFALLWFFACWGGILWLGNHYQSIDKSTMTGLSKYFRHEWMQQMVERENRMPDAALIANLMRSVSFFASTSILILAGLVATLGVIEDAIDIVRDIAWAQHVSPMFWKLKILILIVVFVYAFFKLIWSLRQFNSTVYMIGATPPFDGDKEQLKNFGIMIARVLNRAAQHFNEGMRSYEYGLAILAWFINPWLFIVATIVVTLVIYRREFASRSLKAMEEHQSAPDVDSPDAKH